MFQYSAPSLQLHLFRREKLNKPPTFKELFFFESDQTNKLSLNRSSESKTVSIQSTSPSATCCLHLSIINVASQNMVIIVYVVRTGYDQ